MNFKKIANVIGVLTAGVNLFQRIKRTRRGPKMRVEGVIGIFRVPQEMFDEVCALRFCYNEPSDGYVYLKAEPEQTKQLRRLGLRARPECEWYKVVLS